MNAINQVNQPYEAYINTQQAAQNAPNDSVFNGLEGLIGDANNMAARANALAERLCGAVPEKGESSAPHPVPNGLLEALGTAQHSIRVALIRAVAAIDRIESKLP